MDSFETSTVECTCCGLDYPARLTSTLYEPYLSRGVRCRSCNEHQGKPLDMAQDHEAELRRRLGDTQDELCVALGEVEQLKGKLRHSWRIRDEILENLEKATDHHKRASDGGCTCGERKCATLVVAEDPMMSDQLGRLHKRKFG